MTVLRPRIGVGLLLLDGGGRLLLGHRIKAGETPNWCMPGGHLELGETFEQAALREAAEEAGAVGLDPVAFAAALEPASGISIGVAARAASTSVAVLEPEVLDRWDFFDLDELPDPLYPATAALLAAWRGQPAPPGWHLYPLHSPMIAP